MFQSLSMGLSSWADVNQDGFTNQTDLDIIEQNFGPCPSSSRDLSARKLQPTGG
jgi:hypothetical protein